MFSVIECNLVDPQNGLTVLRQVSAQRIHQWQGKCRSGRAAQHMHRRSAVAKHISQPSSLVYDVRGLLVIHHEFLIQSFNWSMRCIEICSSGMSMRPEILRGCKAR